MENDVRLYWDREKENLSLTIDDMNTKHNNLKSELSKQLKAIETLREDIAYADREDKLYLREELNNKRD